MITVCGALSLLLLLLVAGKSLRMRVVSKGRRKERQVEQGGDTYEKRYRTSGSERQCEQVKNVC